jgi:chromosome segregation ATPase
MKGYKVILGLIALGFAAGMFGGYRIWGTKDKGETDIQQLLQQLSDEVGRMESKNRELTESLEASRETVNASEALRKENQDLKDQLQNAFQEKQGWDNALAEVREKEREAENQAEEQKKLGATIDELKGRIQSLEGENRDLMDRQKKSQQESAEKESLLNQVRSELSAAREEAVQGEKLRKLTDDLNARISVLENENQELKSVIDNISEMTQRNEVPGR